MGNFYIPINAKSPEEYYQRCLELESRGYEPHRPMKMIIREHEHLEVYKYDQGAARRRTRHRGGYDVHRFVGSYRKVEA